MPRRRRPHNERRLSRKRQLSVSQTPSQSRARNNRPNCEANTANELRRFGRRTPTSRSACCLHRRHARIFACPEQEQRDRVVQRAERRGAPGVCPDLPGHLAAASRPGNNSIGDVAHLSSTHDKQLGGRVFPGGSRGLPAVRVFCPGRHRVARGAGAATEQPGSMPGRGHGHRRRLVRPTLYLLGRWRCCFCRISWPFSGDDPLK